jgi:hypothetical protein
MEYIRGPEVNLSIYKKFESYEQSFDKFLNEILPNLISNITPKLNLKVLCVSHGNSMMDYFKNKYNVQNIPHPLNTQTYEEIIKYNDYTNILDKKFNGSVYKPILIRTTYENFESINSNVCLLDGLKGSVNNVLSCPNTQQNVKFICKNPNKYIRYIKKH